MSFPPAPGRRIAVYNTKGGSGKTTTAVSLAAEFAARGLRVRLMDGDSRGGTATSWLPPQWNGAGEDQRADLSHVLMNGVPLDEATWPTTVKGLGIVPSYSTLGQFELIREAGMDFVLRLALDAATPCDMTLIDCPPNAGAITANALAAAEEVVIPLKVGGLDLEGVADLNQTLALVKRRLSPRSHVVAVVVCDMLPTRFADAVITQMAEDYPDAIHHQVRRTVRVAEAPTWHIPLREHAPTATATADYAELARVLLGEAA